MKKNKLKYSCLSGIIFITLNIIVKFLIYGYDTIWINYMPPLAEGRLPFETVVLNNSIYKMIPFVIIDICVVAIYTKKMYNNKIYNKKIDVLFPSIILLMVLVLIYFLISIQYEICV